MAKRASEDPIPAAKRVKENVDAMGCLLLLLQRDAKASAKEVVEVKERNRYLSQQVHRLDNYTAELEGRLATMENLVGNLLSGGNHVIVESHVHAMQSNGDYDMTDLNRLLEEYETEDENGWWFDDIENQM